MFFKSREKAVWSKPNQHQPPAQKKTPPVLSSLPKANTPQDIYRIGFDVNTMMVTLTIVKGGTSMTLSLNDSEVEHLVRMLNAARRKCPDGSYDEGH